ncbi:MAG TPA: hypothetical protein VGF55_09800 [Gemmataceae bacterium]
MPRGLHQERRPGQKPKRGPEYRAEVDAEGGQPVRWLSAPAEGEALARFDGDARTRARLLHEWLGKVAGLIESVQGWARELGWSTRVIEKPMEDSGIGSYRVPALLLQEGVTKILLEPVGRSSPGSEGVVDLSLMPGYDDLASLYHYEGRWNLHYMAEGTPVVGSIRDAAADPLDRESLANVLAEMKSHAG